MRRAQLGIYDSTKLAQKTNKTKDPQESVHGLEAFFEDNSRHEKTIDYVQAPRLDETKPDMSEITIISESAPRQEDRKRQGLELIYYIVAWWHWP